MAKNKIIKKRFHFVDQRIILKVLYNPSYWILNIYLIELGFCNNSVYTMLPKLKKCDL